MKPTDLGFIVLPQKLAISMPSHSTSVPLGASFGVACLCGLISPTFDLASGQALLSHSTSLSMNVLHVYIEFIFYLCLMK